MYTVYKVTNQLTQDFYIGVHKTDDPNDDYLGSGKVIRQQVALHGPENFTKEILLITEVKHEAYQKEEELVRPLLGTPGCLNIHPGGHGGFGYINATELGNQARKKSIELGSHLRATKRVQALCASDPGFAAKMRKTRMNNLQVAKDNGNYLKGLALGTDAWRGRTHTEATKARMSEVAAARVGTQCWITHPGSLEVRKIKLADLLPHLELGWVRGRRVQG